MKKTIIWIVVIIVLVLLGVYFFSKPSATPTDQNAPLTLPSSLSTTTQTQNNQNGSQQQQSQFSIGTSVNGNPIIAYTYGTGSTNLLVVGGIHGGYEWNTVLVAQQLADYLKANPTAIPANVRVTVIPVLNPDGLSKAVGTTSGSFKASAVTSSQSTLTAARFNANGVDLNRNFDCDWQAKGTWQSKPVSGGSAAFSEPESKAIQSYIQTNTPAAVLVYFSAAGGVYASSCDSSSVSAQTDSLVKAYATASGYPAHETFDSYATTGDMTNWLAKIGTPALSVLLTNHTDTEWSKNLAGVQALLSQLSK